MARRNPLPIRRDAEARGAQTVPSTAIPHRVLASWQRSEEYGVSAEGVEPTWTGTVISDSLLFECGHEVLTALHQTLASEPLALMLTDPDGVVLNRFSGDHGLLTVLDQVHLAPGFAYAEQAVGTNGLGLALADRAPALVRAREHYSANLRSFTCAAVPILHPASGRLEGSINITTWAESSPELLLALAQSAASNTAALMLMRSAGQRPPQQPRGGVFRVHVGRLEPAAGTVRELSSSWIGAVRRARAGLERGQVVAALGEPGSGRATLLAQAMRQAHPRHRILSATVPAVQDVPDWIALWTPELTKPQTAIIVEGVHRLPAWAAHDLRRRVQQAVSGRSDDVHLTWALTGTHLDEVPPALLELVDLMVTVPALRERPDDVLPLAIHLAGQRRMREVRFTPAAERALTGYHWPGNVDELSQVMHDAVARTEVIDVQHLPPALLAGGRRLPRVAAAERDEIVRALAQPDVTMAGAARELGISRATLYRKLSHYGIDRGAGR